MLSSFNSHVIAKKKEEVFFAVVEMKKQPPTERGKGIRGEEMGREIGKRGRNMILFTSCFHGIHIYAAASSQTDSRARLLNEKKKSKKKKKKRKKGRKSGAESFNLVKICTLAVFFFF